MIEMENQDQVKPDGPLAVETLQRLVRARKFIDQCYHLPLIFTLVPRSRLDKKENNHGARCG